VRTDPSQLESVRQSLETAGADIDNSDIAMLPTTPIDLDDKTAKATLRLLDALEELEDVQRVFSNAEFSDEALAAYAE
ncbi:MAG: YebC/PmpR family DNA-binding transcriptional regulator, partial [Dehalococcoidia bacterium]